MSDQVNKEYQATPAATLEQQIMNPNFPKNEREWWAAARIEQLEEANELMLTDIRRTDVDMMAFKTEIEHYRKTLRDIVRQCNNPIYGSAPGMERMIDRIEDMAIDALGIATKPMKQDASDE